MSSRHDQPRMSPADARQRPSLPERDAHAASIDAYLDHLRVARRLAPNTLESYARDLAPLAAFRRRKRTRASALDAARSRSRSCAI